MTYWLSRYGHRPHEQSKKIKEKLETKICKTYTVWNMQESSKMNQLPIIKMDKDYEKVFYIIRKCKRITISIIVRTLHKLLKQESTKLLTNNLRKSLKNDSM